MAEEEQYQGFPTTQETGVPADGSDNVETPAGFALGAAMAQGENGGRSDASSVSGDKVWIHNIGWRVLPTDAQRGQGNYWAWDSTNQWFKFHTDEELSASSEAGSWTQIRSHGLDSAVRTYEKFEKDGDIPEWDGKTHR